MNRSFLVVKGVVLAAALLLVISFGLRAAVEVVSHPQTGNEGPPVAILESLEREIATPAVGKPVRVEFPVFNAGERRLVIRSLRQPCCDGPAPEPTFVAPGKSGKLIVEIDAQSLLKRGQHTEGFGTNDPRLPEFWLTVRLTGTGPATAAAAAASSDRSVLKRPSR